MLNKYFLLNFVPTLHEYISLDMRHPKLCRFKVKMNTLKIGSHPAQAKVKLTKQRS